MNAKQRNANRETAQTLRFAIGDWNSRNRRIELNGKPLQQPKPTKR